jgi:hypothetical protein
MEIAASLALLIAMDGMYAENAGAIFCRNDKLRFSLETN